MATNTTTSGASVPTGTQETILRTDRREISLLVADETLCLTHANYTAGERVAGPHIHHQHTDAFYVLEGQLTFEIGAERQTFTVGAGSLVAAPPGLAHSFRTAGHGRSRWLTIHAPDGGFAAFMRGIRDSAEIDWDIAPAPANGGLPADHAIISPPSEPPSSS
jgi:mannose-6-phosphate isomerase-like protein (cupin superfamily)